MRPAPRSFFSRQDGATTIEFVVVFIAFIGIMFFVVEVTLYLFFMASLEKAAEAGVRAAVVSDKVVDFPSTIATDGGVNGYRCSDPRAKCISFTAAPCTGGPCFNGLAFDRILNHMRGFNGGIQAENVTITYTDVGIGFAGGPTTPMVTVTVHGVPFQTGILGSLLGSASGLATLPTRSASMTGEDLAQ